MTWARGSTLAPNLRTIWPSTSSRPAPMSSSQARLLPTPAAASTFCSRTPPGTSVSESRSPGSIPQSSSPSAWPSPARLGDRRRPAGGSLPPRGSRRAVMAILFVVEMVGQERGELGQLVEAGDAEPFQEIHGRAEQGRPGFLVGPRFGHQAPEGQRAHHPVAVDAAYGRNLRPADRLAVGDDGKRLQGSLGQPYLLAVADEPFHHRG